MDFLASISKVEGIPTHAAHTAREMGKVDSLRFFSVLWHCMNLCMCNCAGPAIAYPVSWLTPVSGCSLVPRVELSLLSPIMPFGGGGGLSTQFDVTLVPLPGGTLQTLAAFTLLV